MKEGVIQDSWIISVFSSLIGLPFSLHPFTFFTPVRGGETADKKREGQSEGSCQNIPIFQLCRGAENGQR